MNLVGKKLVKPVVLNTAWLPPGRFEELAGLFPECEFVDGRDAGILDKNLSRANIAYGLPPLGRLAEASNLRWVQLISAGVHADTCAAAKKCNLQVTNLAGLYGPTIAEHAIAMMLVLSRNLQVVLRNQLNRHWDRDVSRTMQDLHGKTLAVLGLGNIGQNIARLGRAHGMRVVGCRRVPRTTPYVDEVVGENELRRILAEADHVAVAAPMTPKTLGMLGPAEFAAMKKGVIYINVSRGSIAQEKALLQALESGQVLAAGLDVFAVEPLAAEHPFWTMPQVLVSPHYSGETVNQSSLPSERFARNLRSWLTGKPLEGVVNLDEGY